MTVKEARLISKAPFRPTDKTKSVKKNYNYTIGQMTFATMSTLNSKHKCILFCIEIPRTMDNGISRQGRPGIIAFCL